MNDRQLLLDETPAQITFRAHDMPEFLQIFFDRPADDGVAIIAPQFHFARSGDESRVDLLGRFRSALHETAAEFVEIRRHNKNIGQRLANEWIVAVANGGRALGVDVDQNIDAVFQIRKQRFAQRSIIISMDLRVFEKIAGLRPRVKIGGGQKLIIFAFNLSGAWRPRRARDRVNKIGALAKGLDECRLSCAGWRGNDEKNSVTAELFIQGSGLAREFSPAPLCRRRRAAKWEHRLPLRRGY